MVAMADRFRYEDGWQDIERVVDVPGWDTHWLRNDEDQDFQDFVAVVAISVKRYEKGKYSVRQLLTNELITGSAISLADYLEQSWNSQAEGAA